MKLQKYFAELFGTFVLATAVSLSLLIDLPLATPILAGLTLGIFVYTIGAISGAHLNPAITTALWAVKKISGKEAINYILAQLAGGLLALLLGMALVGNTSLSIQVDSLSVALAEAFGALILAFGVSSVVYGKTPDEASGLVIGGSLLLGILTAVGFSNGVLNPAVAVGVNSISLSYLLAPLVGATLGAFLYRYIVSK